MFVFPLLSLSLAQRRVWLGEATKSGAAMAAPAAPAPTALGMYFMTILAEQLIQLAVQSLLLYE